MTDWSEQTPANPVSGLRTSGGIEQCANRGQTRRTVLGGLLAVASASALSTNAIAVQTTQGEEETEHPLADEPNRPGPRFGTAPTSEHCPPTMLTQGWQSTDLGTGVTAIQVRADSPEDEPVYGFGGDETNPPVSGQIYALDRQTGSVLDGWPISTDGFPVVRLGTGDSLFYSALNSDGPDKTIAAVDAETGAEKWSQSIMAQGGGFGLHYNSDRGELYNAVSGPTITAFDTDTGDELWSGTAGQGLPVLYSTRDGDRLYIAGSGFSPSGPTGALVAADISPAGQGSELWTDSRDRLPSSTPAIGPDFVSMAFTAQSGDSAVVTLEAASGNERWVKQRSDGLTYGGVPIFSDEAVYIAATNNPEGSRSDGELVKFGAEDGAIEWTFDANGMILGVRLDETTAYVQTRPGEVIAIDNDPQSDQYGGEVWRQTLVQDRANGIRDGGFTLECGTLYTGTVETPGSVYAIDAASGEIQDSFTLDAGVSRIVYSQGGAVWATSGRPFDEPEADVPNQVYKLSGNASDSPPPIVGDSPPQDLDDDGLYRDIDGDGEFTLSDVSQFFEAYRSEAVQQNAGFFDFDNDGKVTLADVQALYDEFVQE